MATYSTNEFRQGLKIMLDGEPCVVVESEFVKPGKGQAFARVRLRKLISNKLLEKTFKSTDSAEGADVMDLNLTYLYNDGEFWHFMNNETFEQLAADEKAIGQKYRLKPAVQQSRIPAHAGAPRQAVSAADKPPASRVRQNSSASDHDHRAVTAPPPCSDRPGSAAGSISRCRSARAAR